MSETGKKVLQFTVFATITTSIAISTYFIGARTQSNKTNNSPVDNKYEQQEISTDNTNNKVETEEPQQPEKVGEPNQQNNNYTEVQMSKLSIKTKIPNNWIFTDTSKINQMNVPELYEIKTKNFDEDGGTRIYFLKDSPSNWNDITSSTDNSWDRSIWKIGKDFRWGYYQSVDGLKLGDITCNAKNECKSGILTQIEINNIKYHIRIEYTGEIHFLENSENITNAFLPPFAQLKEAQNILSMIEKL